MPAYTDPNEYMWANYPDIARRLGLPKPAGNSIGGVVWSDDYFSPVYDPAYHRYDGGGPANSTITVDATHVPTGAQQPYLGTVGATGAQPWKKRGDTTEGWTDPNSPDSKKDGNSGKFRIDPATGQKVYQYISGPGGTMTVNPAWVAMNGTSTDLVSTSTKDVPTASGNMDSPPGSYFGLQRPPTGGGGGQPSMPTSGAFGLSSTVVPGLEQQRYQSMNQNFFQPFLKPTAFR